MTFPRWDLSSAGAHSPLSTEELVMRSVPSKVQNGSLFCLLFVRHSAHFCSHPALVRQTIESFQGCSWNCQLKSVHSFKHKSHNIMFIRFLLHQLKNVLWCSPLPSMCLAKSHSINNQLTLKTLPFMSQRSICGIDRFIQSVHTDERSPKMTEANRINNFKTLKAPKTSIDYFSWSVYFSEKHLPL